MGFNFSIFEMGGEAASTVGGIAKYPSASNFPLTAEDGDVAIALDTNVLYSYDTGVGAWVIIGGPGVAITVSDTASVNLDLTTNVLMADVNFGATTLPADTQGISLHIQPTGSTGIYGYFPAGALSEVTSSILQFSGPGKVVGFSLGIEVNAASGVTPGYVTIGGQTFGGAKTFGSLITGFSGVAFPLGAQTINLGVPAGLTTYSAMLPANPGTTYAMWLANGAGGVTLSQFGNLTNIQSKNAVYIDAVNYATVQSAVDYAESLVAADSSPGVVVIIPAGDFSENVLIKKNISLLGAGVNTTRIGTVTVRPTSNVVAPDMITITDLSIIDAGGLVVSNETASGSGVFNLTMLTENFFLSGLFISEATIENIGNFNARTISVNGPFNLTNIGSAELVACFIPEIYVVGDDSATGAPAWPTLIYADLSSLYSVVDISKGGGVQDPELNCFNCVLGAVAIGANTVVRVTGGTAQSRTGTPSVWNCTSPFTPATSGNWPVQPTNVDEGLDLLAARVAAGGVTLGTFLYAGSAKGATITAGSTFQNLSLAWGDTTNPGLVGTTHQVWSGDKRTIGNYGANWFQFFGGSLISLGSSASAGYTLMLPPTQGSTQTIPVNNGLGQLSWGANGTIGGDILSVSAANGTATTTTRFIGVTTTTADRSVGIDFLSGITGVVVTVQKLDSGLGQVLIGATQGINGASVMILSGQWSKAILTANGSGFYA